jgi:hypothetical protein
MQLRYFFLTILLFLVSEDFSFAQQSTEWTVPEGTIVHLGGESINDIAYSPDGELLAVASGSGIWLYDTVTHQEVTRLVFHNNSVYSISFSPDGKTLASGDSGGIVSLWDVATGTLLWSGSEHHGKRASVSFRPDGKTLASAGSDGKILLWSVGWPAADVNRDDTVNILDLVLVAGEFGKIGENDTDVNGDGIVNIQDLVLVAGAFGEGAAAPFALRHNLKGVVSRVEVQKWLTQAQQLNRTDPTSLQGIAVLEQLLAALTPKETTLLPNYPNPFNPETWIPYQLAKPAEVTLTIYDINGRVVRDLDLGHQRAGIYQTQTRAAYWDGRNAVGEPVASGVYFYSLKAGDFTATRKMLIRK